VFDESAIVAPVTTFFFDFIDDSTCEDWLAIDKD
jgi:hypothetical protein